MPTLNVQLTEHFGEFIAAGVESGRYTNASDAVRAGLRLLEQQEQEDKAKLEWLRGAVLEGVDAIQQGESTTLSSAQEIDAFVSGIHREVERELHASEVARV